MLETQDFKDMKLELDVEKWDYRHILPKIPAKMMTVLQSMDECVVELVVTRMQRDKEWKRLVDFYYVEKESSMDLTVSVKNATDRDRYLNSSSDEITRCNISISNIEKNIKYHENIMKYLRSIQDICRNLYDIDKFRSGK